MSRKADDEDTTMPTILAAHYCKMFTNSITMTSEVGSGKGIYEQAIHKMAEDIQRAACLAGQRVIPGTGKTFVRPGWMEDTTTIAAKIYSVMSATPEQFVSYAAFRLEDAREERDRAVAARKAADERLASLCRKVYAAKTLKQARKAVDEDEP